MAICDTPARQVNTHSSARLISNLRRHTFLLGTLLGLGTLALYSPVIHHEFLSFDDRQYVVRNIQVNTGLHLANLIWAFTTFDQANWHPLTWISHMADCQLLGVNSGAQHLVNAALHAINAFLLFWLLRKGTGSVWRSVFVAALLAVHPLNVATVAWLAERKSLLSALFSLLTIAAYGWYARCPGVKRYLVVAFAFSLALMSKPMAVTLPLALILVDYWPLQRDEDLPFNRRWSRLSLEKLPLLAMSAASSFVTVVAQRSGGAVVGVSELPLSLRLGNATLSYVFYIGKTLWPAKLAMFYPHPQNSLQWSDAAAAAIILLAITGAVLYFRNFRYLVTGWFLFLITLVPVIGIVQVGRQAMADHYAYIPCIGLFIMIAWGVADLANAAAVPPVVPAIASSCAILALSVATIHYLGYWQNGVQLFTEAAVVAGHPDPAIEEALADALVSAHRIDEAISITEKPARCARSTHCVISIWRRFSSIDISSGMPSSSIKSRPVFPTGKI
jgi:protein O-mannosyl-transferase